MTLTDTNTEIVAPMSDPPAAPTEHSISTRLPHRIWTSIRWMVPIALLGLILWRTDWQSIIDHARQARQPLLWSAFALYQVAVMIQAWRWYVALRSDGREWPFWRIQLVNYVSMFFDSFTPGKLGSDAYRVAAMHRCGTSHHLVMSLLAIRLHGMTASIVFAGITGTIVLTIKHGWVKAVLPAVGVALLVFFGLPPLYNAIRRGTLHVKNSGNGFAHHLACQLQKAHDAIKFMFSQPDTRRASNWLVFAYMLAIVTVYWLVGQAFGMTLPFRNYLAVVPVLILAAVIPVSIQGRGLTEVIAIALWHGQRASPEQILLTCLTVFAIMVVQGLIGGAIWCAAHGYIRDTHPQYYGVADATGAEHLAPSAVRR